MSGSWDEYAAEWDTNEAVTAYADNAYLALQNTVELEGLRILDFGCGTGLLTERLSNAASSVVGLDASQKMISVLENKCLKNVATIASELDQDLIKNNDLLSPKFDLVVASSALAFVPDYVKTLRLLKQLLNKGGCLVHWDWLKEEGDEGYGFTEQQIKSALTEAGFAECSTSVPFSLQSEGSALDVLMGVAKNG
ncbi:class I SAM-dependent methyltransferase [Marinobacter salarius]|uniref:class I SAM-dependent DNA methyltransferase n=1 Tax=Marinobacter salarius TaxID=1420917 RepID=UPI001D192536|nr:class I SAM-dependent methyltransferase [Marinobacter salarius]MCC4283924.1 class I SAM-dependent methyltransferase [Marinobacter salarius]